ncbi:MAG: MarR family winged helix-turn-helix transcriptional regulator [Chloroflexota bacterium]
MAEKFEAENLILTTWLMVHRADALLKICEDKLFSKYKLNAERYAVLVTIQYFGGSAKPSEVARWLQRSPNSISMLADRMVRAGLIRRTRDRIDRRVVNLTISDRGKNALKPATQAGWEFIQEILSPLSNEDRRTLINLLKMINHKTLEYLNPGADIEGMLRDEAKHHGNLWKRLVEYLGPSVPGAKAEGSEKGKSTR